MKTTNKYVFFWNGIYSQWHKANMTIGKIEYNSCEQYMMHQKALLFGDEETAELIMQEKNPREQKKFGRMVKNFDKSIWERNCLAIVYEGNLAKFSQNEDLKEELLATDNRILVEASPVDSIYGIGLAEDGRGIEDPSNWRGLNILGSIITMVKNELR